MRKIMLMLAAPAVVATAVACMPEKNPMEDAPGIVTGRTQENILLVPFEGPYTLVPADPEDWPGCQRDERWPDCKA